MIRLAASVSRATLPTPTAANTVLAEVRQVGAEGTSVVSLMRGEPDLPTPAHISDAAVRGTLRVSFASGGDPLTEGLERLRKGLSRL